MRVTALIVIVIIVYIYKQWFLQAEIIGGDWPYVHVSELDQVAFIPSIWSSVHGNGLGGVNPAFFLQYYMQFSLWLAQTLNIPWPVVYKLLWFYPFLIGSFYFSWLLARYIGLRGVLVVVSSLIYTSNTYILLVAGGGQMGIALSYSFIPLVLYSFLLWFEKISRQKPFLRQSILLSTSLSVLGVLDPRILYITGVSCLAYVLLRMRSVRNSIKPLIMQSMVTVAFFIAMSAFWLLPMTMVGNEALESLGNEHTNANSLSFFSVAKFENSLSLLHPNYPENIFGKVYFLKTRFLLIPILAFLPLLVLGKEKKDARKNVYTIFFCLLALIGAFLAKGTNEPFGAVYRWLFSSVPGFVAFRDPTKWYILTSVSYAMLIPVGLQTLSTFMPPKLTFLKNTGIVLLFILVWIFLAQDAFTGKLGGTFNTINVPIEYTENASFLGVQPEFFRTLWIPKRHRFSFDSLRHPAMEASVLFGTTDNQKILDKFMDSKTEELISTYGVKYVIVPFDSTAEVFTKDGTYDSGERDSVVAFLDTISWLEKVQDSALTIYRTRQSKGLFFSSTIDALPYIKISPSRYLVVTEEEKELFFSERFNSLWNARIGNSAISGSKTQEGITLFSKQAMKGQMVEIFYDGQKYVIAGIVISFSAFVLVLSYLLFGRKHAQ